MSSDSQFRQDILLEIQYFDVRTYIYMPLLSNSVALFNNISVYKVFTMEL